MKDLCIDLGCGAKKKPGLIGVDKADAPGVDHVVDFEKAPLPFPDRSVGYVHLSHCLEHIEDPVKLFTEITRVCREGARIDLWGPYAWENSAFIYDHKHFFNEDHFLHPCVLFPDFWWDILTARWLLHGFTYIVPEDVLRDLDARHIPLYIALRYLKGIAQEFCAHVEVTRDRKQPAPDVRRHVGVTREGERFQLPWGPPQNPERKPLARIVRRLGLAPVADGLSLEGTPSRGTESPGSPS